MSFHVLVFFISYFTAPFALATLPAPTVTSSGFCFEVHAGAQKIGSVLEVKKFHNNIHTDMTFTQLDESKLTPSRLQILKSESDEHFMPLQANFEVYEKQKLIRSRTSSFENKKDQILIKTKDHLSKKPTTIEEPKGLVLAQQMSDLLFERKNITEISPKEKLVFQTFSESDGKIQQVTTHLEGQSDHLVLVHQIEGLSFKTTHASDGALISSHDLTKNLMLKPCSESSVLKHLNSALSYKQFKSLFSNEDREKIKKCCQHF